MHKHHAQSWRIVVVLLLTLALLGCRATPPPPTLTLTVAPPTRAATVMPMRLTAAPPPTPTSIVTPSPPPSTMAPSVQDWPTVLANDILVRWPNPQDIVGQGWEYNSGIVLYGLARVYEQQRDPRLLEYIQGWVDGFVAADGAFALPASRNLDLVQPANLLLFLYEQTGEARYLAAAQTIADDLLANHPRNAAGGFWHKDIYPDQMWVDSVYMAGPFLARLSALTGNPVYGDAAAQQALLLASQAQDPATGLLRHGWDASGQAAWAEADTGLSPVVWSRGMGWYAMALVDMLQALPADHPGRDALLDVFQRAAAGLAETQDAATGLWFQVLDQPTLPGNWVETSGSGMIVYALQTGVDAGLLEPRYAAVAARGWQGLQAQLTVAPDGAVVVAGAVEGMGVQTDAAAYLTKLRRENSPHGLLAALLAASSYKGE